MTENSKKTGKLIILSAPSGSGKTTIMRRLLEKFPNLEFSVSATSRPPRGREMHGRDYYFLTADEFRAAIDQGRFVEWEEVYEGTHYGTLHSELERIWERGNAIVFDVDVMGGLRLKSIFGGRALAIFVMPPSLDELRCRLEGRGTDSPESIAKRMDKACEEITKAPLFDCIIVNDILEDAIAGIESAITDFLNG